jgi:phytoene dehydrogenase-like protein
MAPQTLPDQLGTAAGFYIMIPSIHYYGQAIPQGGSGMLSEALVRMIHAQGGTVLTNASVARFIVRNKTCVGLRLEDGREIEARRAVVTALEPKQTFLRLMEPGVLDGTFLDLVRKYTFGDITICRVHYALHEAPRFKNGTEMDRTAFQRIFGSMADIDLQYREIGAGIAPTSPFLWTACWTNLDPTRAPPGKHTLIADTFVPIRLANGADWEQLGPAYVDEVLLPQLQRYTTNMSRDNIIAQCIDTGPSIARANLCLVDGSTNGGERTLAQLGAFRPVPGYANYRAPLRNLYMTGPSCHPGGGISAMGTNTANLMLEDLGLKSRSTV